MIFLVVDAVFDFVTIFIQHAFIGPPTGQVLVQVDAHHLIGRKKTVVDPLFENMGQFFLGKLKLSPDILGLLPEVLGLSDQPL